MSFDQGHELDPSQNQNRNLDTCPACGSRMLQANEFEEIADGVWLGLKECPDCEWSKTEALDRDAMDELAVALDERDYTAASAFAAALETEVRTVDDFLVHK